MVRIIFFALLAAGAAPVSNATWHSIAPESERFAVRMPGRPVSHSDGFVSVHSVEWRHYRLSVTSVREPRLGTLPPGAAIALFASEYEVAFREALRDDTKADPLEFRADIRLGDAVGREYTVTSSAGPGILRMYLTASDIFVVVAIGGDERDATVRRFIDSFSLRPERSNTVIGPLRTASGSPVSGDTREHTCVEAGNSVRDSGDGDWARGAVAR